MAHYTDILPNGLRLVCERTDSDVVYCGYVVGAGTRHEDTADEGMAHFVEHLSFKGTARRNSAAVNNALERYGGIAKDDMTALAVRILPSEPMP